MERAGVSSGPGRRLGLHVFLGFCLAIVLCPNPTRAEDSGEATRKRFFRCDRRHDALRDFALSDASINVAHGFVWLAGGAGISLGANPARHWTRENAFDDGAQSGLRLDSDDARRDADSAGDFFAGLSVGILPVAAIAARFARTHDCIEAGEMFGEAFESVGLALFVSEAIKIASGRERPFGDRCADQPPSDANCNRSDRNLSFVSGHATLAAAGAGISCRFALEREAFGPGSGARVAPCALGILSALTAGTLRIAADRHWATDVLVGFGVGALVGSFDLPGPLEWLRVEQRDASGRLESSGMLLPFAREGRVGAQWTMLY